MNGQSSAPLASNGITPLQQMVASCSGAIITSLVGEFRIVWKEKNNFTEALLKFTYDKIGPVQILFRTQQLIVSLSFV